MLLDLLSTNDVPTRNISENFEYSPPKDALDSKAFDAFFSGGSFPLADGCQEDRCDDDLSILNKSYLPEEAEMALDALSTIGSDKGSDSGSLITCAQTNKSTSGPTLVETPKSQLEKRAPNFPTKTNWESEFYGDSTSAVSKSDGLSTVLFDGHNGQQERKNQQLVALATRLIDRQGNVSADEWDMLDQSERAILISYMENIYNLHLTSSDSGNSLNQLNSVLELKTPSKRNEEKLKKTAKKINALITEAFTNINGLRNLSEDQLEQVMCQAYFGQVETAEKNIFSHKHPFSQKAFQKVVANRRYAEDFEVVLNNNYLPAFIQSRQETIQRSIDFLRRKINKEESRIAKASCDLIKRAPWSLSEILDGVKLCQTLIARGKQLS